MPAPAWRCSRCPACGRRTSRRRRRPRFPSGDDARVAHVNELLRAVTASDPATVTFVEGPDEWCGDESVATDLGVRWDGVHVYKPGAALIYETIAPVLLTI